MGEVKQKALLNEQEERELHEGQVIYEMTQSEGWKIVSRWLTDLAIHSWVDPRTIDGPDSEKEWKWRELNAFYAANNASELLERIQKTITQIEYLSRVKNGEVKRGPMTV